MGKEIELTLMLADYHRTRPLLKGEVTAKASHSPRNARKAGKPASGRCTKNSTSPRCLSPGT